MGIVGSIELHAKNAFVASHVKCPIEVKILIAKLFFLAVQHLESGYYSNLKTLIEKTYTINGNQKIVLVVHSMGAITSLYFLNKVVDQSWKDMYIRSYISIAGAWQGVAKSVKAFASGDNENIIIDKDIWDRAGQRTSPSTAWLLPNPSDVWPKDDVLVVTDEKNYSAWDYKELFTDMGYPRGYEMYLEVMNLTGIIRLCILLSYLAIIL